MNRRVIVRLRGGLGNQLFCYAAGRALAEKNRAELVLDTVSDFASDVRFARSYALGPFNIVGRVASAAERLEPFGRWRRLAARWRTKRRPFEQRTYLVEEHRGWDPRVLSTPVRGTVTLDGSWQSYRYFQDVADAIRQEIRMPDDDLSIKSPTASRGGLRAHGALAPIPPTVAVHVRWFDIHEPDSPANLALEYYRRAISQFEAALIDPHYLLFSDDIERTERTLDFLPTERTTFASADSSDPTGVNDLMRMSRCRHFVIANSTFSWWGAWLGSAADKQVIAPNPDQMHAESFWRAPDLLPPDWHLL